MTPVQLLGQRVAEVAKTLSTDPVKVEDLDNAMAELRQIVTVGETLARKART